MKQKMFLFGALFCINNSLHAVIVFLQGTGCAGKTSLCSALLATDSSWRSVDEDAIYYKKAIDNLQSTFPQEFLHIATAIAPENIFHAIKRGQIIFKDTATMQEKTKAEIAIYGIKKRMDEYTLTNQNAAAVWHDELKVYLISCIKDLADAGCNVVVDNWLLSSEHIEMLKREYKTMIVWAYCPIKELVNRTLARNYQALLCRNLYGARYFHQALMSFKGLYDFQEEKSEKSIDAITREEVNNTLDVVELSLTGNTTCGGSLSPFSREEFSRTQLYEYRLFFMKKFLNTDVLYIVPQGKVDAVIKTAEISAQEAAQQLLTLVKSVRNR